MPTALMGMLTLQTMPLPLPIPDFVVPSEPIPTIMLKAPAERRFPFLNLRPPPTQLPQAIRELAGAAFEARDDTALNAILKLARRTNPQAVAQIEALEAEYSALRAEEAARKARDHAENLAAASLLDNWKGEVEFGGSRSTGNTDSAAIYGAVRFEREGLKWRHLLNGRIDFQRSNGNTTADRWKFSWQPNFKANETVFAYGLGQYERDRFLGFHDRFTLSSGVGWTIVSTPKTKLSFQGGPALRFTNRVDKSSRATGAGRGSLAFRWKISPTLSVSQDAAVYLEEGNHNASATTTFETRLLGALKARLSYDVQYEDVDLVGREPLDTTSRATLVYRF